MRFTKMHGIGNDYVYVNGFTETVLRSPDRGEVMRWPVRIGTRPLL